MAECFCGVDIGGTSTRAVVADVAGSHIGWGHANGANPTHAGWEAAGCNIGIAVKAACALAGISSADIQSVFLGMAGVITPSDRRAAARLAGDWGLASGYQVSADHDIRIALEGGLSGRPGIALIAGTGSSCYGRNATGETWQSGGWDQLLDDLGSGYDLAQKGMAAACQSADGRVEPTRLQEKFFASLGARDVMEFSRKVHRPRMARYDIAALAPLVLDTAEQGDRRAEVIVHQCAESLASMVYAVAGKLFPDKAPEIVLIGSALEKSSFYHLKAEAAILALLPAAIIHFAELRPAVGAWSLAARQTGAVPEETVLQQLSKLSKF